MPMHDWRRVGAWVYHDFHTAWMIAIRRVLNSGVLPAGYYARAEQTLRTMGPDVLTLQRRDTPPTQPPPPGTAAGRVAFRAAAPPRPPGFRAKRIAVRHGSDDRLVAILELVSPGNTSSRPAVREFVGKLVRAVEMGMHVLVIDPFPPGKRDRHGLHSLVWSELGGDEFVPPADKPLYCFAYESRVPDDGPRCYVQPFAVGDPLPDMPLFLEPDLSVDAPLERTYLDAWADVLPQDRALLEAPE